jgi:pyrroline-5-carboxylate reductase
MNLAADKKSIGFIGAGIMGASLIRGLLSSSIKANQIYISEKTWSEPLRLQASLVLRI